MNDELDSAYTSDAAQYDPYLDSDPNMTDQDSGEVADGRVSESEADRDRLMISYTEHFDHTTACTSDDICEVEEDQEEDGMLPTSVLPESQQGGEADYFVEEVLESRRLEVRPKKNLQNSITTPGH